MSSKKLVQLWEGVSCPKGPVGGWIRRVSCWSDWGFPYFIFLGNLSELIQFMEWKLNNGYVGLRVATEIRKTLLLGKVL